MVIKEGISPKLLVGDLTLSMITAPVYRPPEPAKDQKPAPTAQTARLPTLPPGRSRGIRRDVVYTWKIKDNRLYYKQPVPDVPGQPPRVDGGFSFASAYSGVLQTCLGQSLGLVRWGSFATQEHYAFFSFSQGKIESSWVLHNSLKVACYPERTIDQVKLLIREPGIYYCKNCHILATSIGMLPSQTTCQKSDNPKVHSICRHRWSKIDIVSDHILQCNSCGKIVSKIIQNSDLKCKCLSENTKVTRKNARILKKLFNPVLFADLGSPKFNFDMIRKYVVRRTV